MTKKNEWFCRTNLRLTARRFVWTAGVAATLASAAGAAFAAGPERSLGGISIFASGSEVTRKFGNPSRILVGGVAPGAASTLTGGGTSGAPGSPMGGGMGGSMPGGMGGMSGGSPGMLPGLGSQPGGGSTYGLPGMGGFPSLSSAPGMGGGMPGMGGGMGGPGSLGVPTGPPPKPPVTLIYDRPNGGSLEFTVSPDKLVIQIRETGYNGAYGTSRGIKLGVKYSDVIAHYGYPENTYIQGAIISIDYKDTLHCGFQFLDQRLVGIIVATPD